MGGVRIKNFQKVGNKTYRIDLARSEAMFELIAQIAIPDGYPDKTCTFTLSVTHSSAHNQSKSKGAEEEKQTIMSFSKLSEQVEPVLAEMKKELE